MYKVAGVSKFGGESKVRFANDLDRVKLLIKSGNSDIVLMDLPTAMTKAEAVTFLKSSELYNSPDSACAIDLADAKYNAAAGAKRPRLMSVVREKIKVQVKARFAEAQPIA